MNLNIHGLIEAAVTGDVVPKNAKNVVAYPTGSCGCGIPSLARLCCAKISP